LFCDWRAGVNGSMTELEKGISDYQLQAVLDIWSLKGHRSTCRISGDCMYPMIHDGDYLTIEHGNFDVRFGDLVVYGPPRSPAVHRVIKVGRDGRDRLLFLKPDRYTTPHPFIPEDQILGKVIGIQGASGYLRLDSFFWKCMMWVMAIRSYVSWRRLSGSSPFWRGVNGLVRVRSIVLPRHHADTMLWTWIQSVHRTFLRFKRLSSPTARRAE
jgi:hypothetical protein